MDSSSLLTVGYKMREKIKELQEKRAAAMMIEITELQRDRDIALSRLKQLQILTGEVQEENMLLKEKFSIEAELRLEMRSLQQLYMEEKLVVSDLKKKLLGVEKKNSELISRIHQGNHSPFIQQRMTQQHLLPIESERSQSMNDLTNKCLAVVGGRSPINSTPSSPSSSPFSSPSLVPRRYKLTTVSTSHQETQTDSTQPLLPAMKNLPRPVLEALASARDDLVQLQDQNQNLRNKLDEIVLEKQKEEDERLQFAQRYEVLKEESAVLCESLSQFSQWVQHKISSVEEEMDMCKVIYSLHGSLSKETQTIEELRQRLIASESTVHHLSSLNEHLTNKLSDSETQLLHSRAEEKLLREQLQRAMQPSSSHRHRLHHHRTAASPLLKGKERRSLEQQPLVLTNYRSASSPLAETEAENKLFNSILSQAKVPNERLDQKVIKACSVVNIISLWIAPVNSSQPYPIFVLTQVLLL